MAARIRRRCIARKLTLTAKGKTISRYCWLADHHGTDHQDRHGFWWFQPTPITKRDQRHHDIWNGLAKPTKRELNGHW